MLPSAERPSVVSSSALNDGPGTETSTLVFLLIGFNVNLRNQRNFH
jgi:hypothetical protein